MPKPKHFIWWYFDCINKKQNSTGKWAKCRECTKEMQGIPSRMEKHILMHPKNKPVSKDEPSTSTQRSDNRLGNYGCICYSIIPNMPKVKNIVF